MTDVENTLRAELNRMLVVDAAPDWDAIVAAAGGGRGGGRRRQRRLAVAAAALLVAAAVALVTPLGGAIARGVEDFSAWLTGEPGAPVAEEEQRAFDEENEHTWLGFPEGTQLRRLITRRVDDVTVELLGFRPGRHRLCLRLTVSGALTERATGCVPLDELRREGGPVRVLITDEGIGRGDKEAWYGIDRVVSNRLLVSAGVAADDVEAVVLRDDVGRHEVPVESSAFLYVAEDPEVGQRVQEVWARTSAGLVTVPFAPRPGVGGAAAPGREPPPAPAVERKIVGGTIGWLADREERGEPLDVLPRDWMETLRHVCGEPVFGRVLTPDPDQPLRTVVTLHAQRAGGPVSMLCFGTVTRFGGGGIRFGNRYPGFFHGAPFTYQGSSTYGASPFTNVTGLVSDDVERLEIRLADGTQVDVPLADNAFTVGIPLTVLPGRIVAYDSDGRVISSIMTLGDMSAGEPAPARGKAELLWRVEGPGDSYAELFVGPSTFGDECMFLKTHVDERPRGTSTACVWQPWARSPVQVASGWEPGRFLNGRVREDVATVRIRFADGDTVIVKPRRGYVLYAMPGDRLTDARRALRADGLDASGRIVGRMEFP